MGNQPLGGRRGVREGMRRHVVAMGMADDRAWPRLPGIEPELLVRQIDAAIPENRIDGHGYGLLGGGRAPLEQLVAKRAIGAEPLPGGPGENAGPPTGWAGLLRLGLGRRCRQLQHSQRLNRFHGDRRFAFGRLDGGRGWCR